MWLSISPLVAQDVARRPSPSPITNQTPTPKSVYCYRRTTTARGNSTPKTSRGVQLLPSQQRFHPYITTVPCPSCSSPALIQQALLTLQPQVLPRAALVSRQETSLLPRPMKSSWQEQATSTLPHGLHRVPAPLS